MVEVDHREVVHRADLTEKARQHIQAVKAVTLDQTHTQDPVVVVEEPQQ